LAFHWDDIDSFGEALFAAPASPDRSLSAPEGVACLYELLPGQGNGYVELFAFADGLTMVVFNCEWREGRTFEVFDADRLRFSFTLDLNISMDFGSQIVDAHTPAWRLINNAADVVTHETVAAGSKAVWVTVAFRRDYLDRFLADTSEAWSRPAMDCLQRSPAQSIVQDFPLDHQLNLITSNLVLLNADDQVYVALAHAKASELIAHALDRLLNQRDESPVAQPRLRTRDREAIRLAADILLSNVADPPSVRELCTAVGVNRNKLNFGFREEFGASPAQYLEEQRLLRAYNLLLETDQLVYQIAADLGYASQSSFSTAFKRHYGLTPSAIRRGTPAAPGLHSESNS